LASTGFVMSEVAESEVYVGAVMVDALDRILSDFDRTEALWADHFGWGDRWWVRRSGPLSYVSASAENGQRHSTGRGIEISPAAARPRTPCSSGRPEGG